MHSIHTTTDRSRAPTEVVLSVLQSPAHTILRLGGEIDIAAAPRLRERLIGALHPGMRLLVLDLSGVSFCDAAGLAVIVGTQRRATLLNVSLRLAAPRPQMAAVLRLTGLDRHLTVHPTLPDALAPEETTTITE